MTNTPEPSNEPAIQTRHESSVAHVTIDATAMGNALTPALRDQLAATFAELSADYSVRAVVLRGAGDRHFCTGAALGAPMAGPVKPPGAPDRAQGDTARLVATGWQRLISSILDCEKPVVAAINGTAAGGGAQLALACDLTVMSRNAKLIQVFVRRGIMPDAGGAYLLPRLIGLHRAKELMFLGEDLDAETAAAWGLVNRVVDHHELDDTASQLADRLAARPTRALSLTKRLVNRSLETSRTQNFDDEAHFQELITATDDCAEGLAAFRDRREPRFQGW